MFSVSFVGAMYDIAGQGIPLILGINQKALTKAITLDSKVSQKLYSSNIMLLKKRIQGEISRGIATGTNYIDIARNLKNQTKITLNNAMRIVRTEGHRIQQVSADDARHQAKAKGADVLKQWDATMDKKTRASHARVDGEIREIDEPFSNGLMFPGDPNGSAAEVINCRCTALQCARRGLDEDELETLKKRAEHFGLDKTENLKDFQEKYLKSVENTEKKNIIKNIALDDFNSIKDTLAEKFGKNITVREDVLDCIYGVLKGAKGLNLYEDIQVKPLGNKIIFQTDSVQHGTWTKNSFIINREAIQGKTVKEIDQRIKDAQNTVCDSLEDAMYHEYMHAKTSQVISFAKYEQLCESKGYPEISKEAAQDLAETIAEIGVLKKQGRYDSVSYRGKKLFEEIIGDSYD